MRVLFLTHGITHMTGRRGGVVRLRTLKTHVNDGLISGFTLSPFNDHFVLKVHYISGKSALLTSRTPSLIRVFKTTDAAWRVVRSLGFSELSIDSQEPIDVPTPDPKDPDRPP